MIREKRFIIALLAVCAVLFFYGLGSFALTDPDESFYAESAREMLDAGEWVTPLIFGQPQFEKPILFYPLVMLSFIAFGVTEFAARFPSAVLAIFGVIGTYYTARLLFSPFAGFLSGLILATCVEYVVLARACVTDMALTVFILYSFLFFLLGWAKNKKFYYFLFSFFTALAVLTKGPIGLFVPAVTIGGYVIISRQWGKIKEIPVILCLVVFLAVSLPWYAAVTMIHKGAFLDAFFGFQNIARFLVPEHRIGTSPFFYIPVILGGFFPWSIFLIFAVWDRCRSSLVVRDSSLVEIRSRGLFLLLWFLVVFLFFSVSRTKLVTYIFPLFPVMAIVTGVFWEKFMFETSENGKRLKKHMRYAHILLVCLGIAGSAAAFFIVKAEYGAAVTAIAPMLAVFVAGLLVSLFFMFKEKRQEVFYSIIVTIVLLIVPLTGWFLPVVEKFESSKEMGRRVAEIVPQEEPLGGENDNRRGTAFYAKRADITDVHPYNALVEFVSREKRVWCVLRKKHYEQLKKQEPGRVSEIIFESGKNVLVSNIDKKPKI